jgi:predicted dehydrogenase
MPRAMPAALHVALIGQGFMGRAHANAWSQVARFFDVKRRPALHTACGRDAEALAAFAERWGFAHRTTRWREVCADPAVDLVDLATPNDLHAAPALAALAAGKHVACEKPLARTLDEARAMRDAARKARGRTFVWFNYRRCPAVAFAWKLVREGALGEIYHVRARYLQSWGGPATPLTWRFKKRLAGSGAHGDLNAHVVDLARFLAGEPIVEVHGALCRTFVRERPLEAGPRRRGARRTGRSDVDDCTAFLASFAGGATASFEASRLALGHLNDNAIELDGSKGSLRFAFEDMNALELYEGSLPQRTAGWRRIVCTAAGEHPYVDAWWPDEHLLGYEHGFTNMAADVLRVLSGGRPEVPLADFADAYETQRVLAAALVAARERRAVKLAELR